MNTTTNKYKNSFAFAAIKTGGTVVSWGNEYNASSKYIPIVTSKIDGIKDVKQIYSTDWGGFAALKNDGSVVTWGSANYGGDSSKVTTQLNGDIDVTQIYSNAQAFAAVRADGSVVTWGNTTTFNNTLLPPASLLIAQPNTSDPLPTIYSTGTAFAALKNDGSVVTWGNATYGGTIPTTLVSELDGKDETGENKDVTQIFSTNTAFAALRADGSVVTWGDVNSGGTIPTTLVSELDGKDETGENKDVTQIFSTNTAFAALRTDGSVVTWGNATYGGDSTLLKTDLVRVQQIYSNDVAFTALTSSLLLYWGSSGTPRDSGNSLQIDGSTLKTTQNGKVFETPLDGVGINQICSTGTAFAALRENGSVMTWGNQLAGGDSSAVKDILAKHDVTQIFSTYNSFAALRKDGSVVTWGSAATGGDSTTDKTLAAKLNGEIDVVQIYSTDYAFSALRADGSVVTWGGNTRLGFGGDSSTVKDLTGVIGFSDSNNRLLTGKATNDTLIGGLGVDTLTGGSGSDSFKFNNENETGIDAKTRDIITDFKHSEGDKIDLSAIDANSTLASDQTFNFVISSNFTKKSGELHFTKGILEGDTNGDGKADFSIQLNGVTTLVAADFVL
jgi:alpha-tubulin suppressor-like RCC1 family protein